MEQRKEYRQILIELMCIDQQSKKTSIYVTKKGIQTYEADLDGLSMIINV